MRGLSETEAEDSWAADVVSQLFPAFLMFILGVETSAIAGEWAQQLNVPGAGFARYAFLLIPAAAFLPAVLPRRISRRDLYSDALMLGLMLFPVALFNLGTRSLTVPGASSGVPARGFRA